MPKIVVKNPASLEVIETFPVPEISEIDLMINNSKKAFIKWKAFSLSQRQEILSKAADAIEARKDELAKLLTSEQGKPFHESNREIGAITSVFRLYAGMPIKPEIIQDNETTQIIVDQEPYGVCALILPWNYPVGLLGWKLAPCLLAGNTAIVKPSQFAPLAVIKCIEIISDFLPDNVVQPLPGGDQEGVYLTRHPGIARISFTGSQNTGKNILKSASENLPKITLEMSGNDAAIILPDCDLDKRFESIFWGCFFNIGQICVAIKRIYVHESIAPELIRRFKEKTEAMKIGNGLEPGVQMGPINNEKQLLKVYELVEDARNLGATIVAGGNKILGNGYFFQPTVLTDLDDSFRIVREEQFGPAIPILTYSDIDDAITRANNTVYGLGGSIWTEDIEIGKKLAKKLECGTVWVNAHMLVEHRAPFGGWKQSGMGRELGEAGLKEFLQTRTLYMVKS
ncbi:MAG: aldehyde dehydrogenase family protein [Thermoplasmata archaeon]|nr:aldehyde dehydrogenase family protein [Thermoplasmata archaeon]